MKLKLLLSLAVIFFCAGPALAARLSDEEVQQRIVAESIADYSGSCACPFNSARNGSRCGKRSAWSRQGGEAPICYVKEVTAEMINQWRAAHNEDQAARRAAGNIRPV
ncbi:hypothetical protein [Erwinia sp. 198]|uniref:hypothetical protein n=1 Tax=Erwinia sp. 198 TaxID=2022746 RepID=UPI000F67942F|nr:hypothetical protein [Erwinia sp. 198]RRZ90286.1 hypothetical protein EGK14_13910 [Erwinia sp. 198]